MASKTISVKFLSSNLVTALTLIFVVAKIMGYLDWSWWLVFAPVWGPIVLVLGILLLMFLGTMAFFIFEEVSLKRRKR